MTPARGSFSEYNPDQAQGPACPVSTEIDGLRMAAAELPSGPPAAPTSCGCGPVESAAPAGSGCCDTQTDCCDSTTDDSGGKSGSRIKGILAGVALLAAISMAGVSVAAKQGWIGEPVPTEADVSDTAGCSTAPDKGASSCASSCCESKSPDTTVQANSCCP